jgi:hypothetical protein
VAEVRGPEISRGPFNKKRVVVGGGVSVVFQFFIKTFMLAIFPNQSPNQCS